VDDIILNNNYVIPTINIKLTFINVIANAKKDTLTGRSTFETSFDMEIQDKTKEELIIELRELHQKLNSLLKLHYTYNAERKLAVEKLTASESRYRRLFESAKDGILILDAETGMIKDVNPFLVKMLGYTKEQFIEKEIWEIGFFKDIAANKDKFFELKQKEYVRYEDLPLETTEGRKINVEFVSNVYSEDHHDVIQCNIRDITERKQAEQVQIIANKEIAFQNEEKEKRAIELVIAKEHAEQSDRLKSAFLANMSHEIRTPMNGILGFSELLKEPGLTGEKQQEYIRIIEKSGARMLNIINNIVDISKIEANQMNVDIKDCNINEKVEFIYIFFKPQVEEKGMQLIYKNSLPINEAIIRSDNEKIYSILTNLVKNAINYSKVGTIEFGYIKRGENLEFYVKDTGIGISKDRQSAIFERFIQADISDKMARQGAGLGLSISKAYVEMLGGKIWVESEEGIGSTFYFTLPYNAEPDKKKAVEKVVLVQNGENQIKDLKILIAEDDKTSEMLITIDVGKFSKEILKARNGFEAVEVCRNNPDTDLILMDIQMPVMNGHEATRQIRQFNKDVVIIAQTAFGLSGDREKTIEAGCNDYISKPINKNELLSLIQKYFTK